MLTESDSRDGAGVGGVGVGQVSVTGGQERAHGQWIPEREASRGESVRRDGWLVIS